MMLGRGERPITTDHDRSQDERSPPPRSLEEHREENEQPMPEPRISSSHEDTPSPSASVSRPGHVYREMDELRLLRFLNDLDSQLRPARDVERALKVAMRATAAFFAAPAACVAAVTPGSRAARLLVSDQRGKEWDLSTLAAFTRGEDHPAPSGLMLATIRRRGRAWGVLAVQHATGLPSSRERDALNRVVMVVNTCVAHIERERMLEVRARIDRKVLVQIRPQDLFYQILDGLRSLTEYDHSATLLIGDELDQHFDIVAEQIAWRKGKSERIGRRLPMSDTVISATADGAVWGITRRSGVWTAWSDETPADLASLVEFTAGLQPLDRSISSVPNTTIAPNAPSSNGSAIENEILCAPLRLRDGPLALLKVSALHPGTFGLYEAQLLAALLPQASVAMQNSRRTETLHAKVLETERKQAMAELARGVAHDVNNAMGAALPLVQQLREEVESGQFNAKRFATDLGHIERSMRVCCRIFGGMLSFARQAARPSGTGDLRVAVDSALAILGDGLARRHITVHDRLPPGLPAVLVSQHEIEQVFLNIISNARDAMTASGQLAIDASVENDAVIVEIADTGCGIPRENLQRVQEPFFTTKSNGNGLGLSVCRDIIWAAQGHLTFESDLGRGTKVRIVLPVQSSSSPAAPDRAASDLAASKPESPTRPTPGPSV